MSVESTKKSNKKESKSRNKMKTQQTKRSPKKAIGKSRKVKQIEQPKKKWKKGMSLLFDLLYYLLVIGIILGSILFVANKDSNKSFFGYRFYNVLTNSMVPQKDSLPGGFHSGDVTIVKMATYDQIKVNDIVTFTVGEGSYLTHRVKEKMTELNGEEGKFMITQGDANKSQDPPVDGSRVVGKVVFVIPYVGNILKFVRDHFVVCLIFLISMFGFVWVLRFYFEQPDYVEVKKGKTKKKPRVHKGNVKEKRNIRST
ncbi:signal peptidase I [Enterococcus termitis]|uniref:Signal peptidase I n=2 Tax=Enterococcus termitis TaxID=332950 RepID=A0A1E5GAV8_9ENTE|nr:signal peptidase I [Enterococcus termitis]